MNSIRQIHELNKRELEHGVPPGASWHADYRDTAYVYIGGLPFELSEGDVITIFSQYGEPAYINLVRDKETGKSRGFAFLKYEDQRSTDLAVDNLGGTVIMGRTLRVDHTRYKKKHDEPEQGQYLDMPLDEDEGDDGESIRKTRRVSNMDSDEERPMLQEERQLATLIQEHDEDDPMKEFLIQEKRHEVTKALARMKDAEPSKDVHKHRHHHHRSRRDKERVGDEEDFRVRHRKRKDHRESRRTRSGEPPPKDDRREADQKPHPTKNSRFGNEDAEDYREGRSKPNEGSRGKFLGHDERDMGGTRSRSDLKDLGKDRERATGRQNRSDDRDENDDWARRRRS